MSGWHLFQVWRHNGRVGAPWRVVFEDRSGDVARARYFDILPRTGISYAATRLVRVDGPEVQVPDYMDGLLADGLAPEGTRPIPDRASKASATVARERREDRQARRRGLRVADRPEVRVAIPVEPRETAPDLEAEQEALAAAEEVHRTRVA